MLKITAAVPTYNSEHFISRCLDSLVQQTMPNDEYEIICIDDCSQDGTVSILKKYGEQYPNIKVIEREKNSGGPGEPRNQAIRAASGEYIFFIDSDDYLGIEAFERMYQFAKVHDSDIVLGKMVGVNGRPVPQAIFRESKAEADLIKSPLVYSIGPTKLFKVSLLRKYDIMFPSNIQATEDQVFVMKAYLKADKISVLGDYDYYYAVQHDGEHMTFAYVAPQDYYGAMKVIIDMIYESRLSRTDKMKFMAKFLNRHFDFSRTTDFTITIEDEQEQLEWMTELHHFVERNIPREIDKLVHSHTRLKLYFVRNNDLKGLKQFESDKENMIQFTSVKNGHIIANYPSIVLYHLSENELVIDDRNKISHYVSKFQIKNNSFSIKGSVTHTALKPEYQSLQKLSGIWVHRERKIEKIMSPVYSKDGEFEFLTKFTDLAVNEDDIGVWDFFIESDIDGYKKRARIGNSREKYPYSKHAKYIGNNGKYAYSARPYFTKTFDNLSVEIKKQEMLKVEFRNHDSDQYLTFIFPGSQLFFPKQSLLLLECNKQEFLIPIKKQISSAEGTVIQVDRNLVEQKFVPSYLQSTDIVLSINSYQTVLVPKKDVSVYFCSKNIEKKLWCFKIRKKVDLFIQSDQSKFYLTAR
ncbi:glycosyltransferase [Bacillus halotolerans]|uniref:glycosyltransferase n=1 Tax=Bacillus halotolerans TaxID=260554 RepID=UPI0039F6A6D6